MRRIVGPCGRGEDHAQRGDALRSRGAAHPGAGRSSGRVSGYPRAGTRKGHHYFFQTGAAGNGAPRRHAGGHPRPCGLFRRSRANHAGAGLRRAGHQRHRRRAGSHPDPLAAAGTLSGTDVFVSQQDGPARNGQGETAGRTAAAAQPRLCGFHRVPGGDRGKRRHVRRGAAGKLSGNRRRHGGESPGADCRTEAVPMLLRFRAETGRRGDAAGYSGQIRPGNGLSRRIRRKSL